MKASARRAFRRRLLDLRCPGCNRHGWLAVNQWEPPMALCQMCGWAGDPRPETREAPQ